MPISDGKRHSPSSPVDKRDFDANRPLLFRDTDTDAEDADDELANTNAHGRRSNSAAGADDGDGDSLFSEVAEGILERDRRRMKREIVRIISFIWGVGSAYVIILLFSFPFPF